jgi:hypothetical protein
MLLELNAYSDIAQKIETMVAAYDIDYLDAVISYCEANNLEIEIVGDIIAKIPSLKSKLQIEAEELHYLKATARLPI